MKLLPIITELFGSTYIYPVIKTDDDELVSAASGEPMRVIRYEFITKDEIKYLVMVNIWVKSRELRIDFHTRSRKNPDHNSLILLIKTNDSIKVFNTLKSIVDKHRDEADSVYLSSIPSRIKFYEKILNHLNIQYTKINDGYIKANL